MIASFYAAVLALIYLGLTYYVIAGRWKYKISIEDGGNKDMISRIRIHGNFAEFVPFALLLLFMVDYARFSPLTVHSLGILLILARLSHVVGLRLRGFNVFRAAGVVLTHAVMIVCAALLIWKFLVLGVTGL